MKHSNELRILPKFLFTKNCLKGRQTGQVSQTGQGQGLIPTDNRPSVSTRGAGGALAGFKRTYNDLLYQLAQREDEERIPDKAKLRPGFHYK